MKNVYRRSGLMLVAAGLCWLAGPLAHATISVDSSNSFGNLTIDPTSGMITFISPPQSFTYAQAGANGQYNSGLASTASSSDVPVPGGSASGNSAASVSGASGTASANGFIPGVSAGFDTSAGRASLGGAFQLTGAVMPVSVVFSVAVDEQLLLSSDAAGVSGQGENVFSLSVNNNPILFNDQILNIGPSDFQSGSYSNLLTATMTLTPGQTYYLWVEADSEAMVLNSTVPEPAETNLWICAGLSLLVVRLARRFGVWKRLKHWKLLLLGTAIAVSAQQTQAKYIGSDRPDVCQTCGVQTTRQPVGTISTSLSEGNLQEDYPAVKVMSAYGPTIPFVLTYNSYNADGSKAQLDTGLGFGWNHTYNTLLFQQRGQMFRLGDDGRVTQYFRNFSGTGQTYASDAGYFETLTMQPDGTFIVTNKNQSWWHFGLVPNTPFLVAGPVYRLLQMGDRNGNTNTMSYNASGLLVSVSDPFGRTVQFTYDTSNHLSSVTDPLGRTTTFQYDSLERVPTRITDPAGNTITYSYNAQYQMTEKVDRDGRTYFYMYKNQLPFAVADSSGQPWLSLSNPENWAVDETNLASSLGRQYIPSTTSNTDGNGNVWKYAYDTNGYITQVTAPDGTTTRYTYDASTRMLSTVTDANNHVTTYQYDAMGNRIQITDALGEVTTYTYEPVFNMMTSMTDPNGRTTTYQYDGHGNRILTTDPLGQTQSWTYDSHGDILTATDQDGHTMSYKYDAFGERTNMTDALGNVTTYAYDAVGNHISTTDPLGRTTRYQYDSLDHLIGITNALGGVTSYTYDPFGRELSMTDPNTNTTTYAYDVRGRTLQTTDAAGGVTSYGYDPNDNRIAVTNQLGHPTTYAYDTLNRVIASTNAIGGTMRYAYDPVGNRISSTDPDTNTTAYAYDSLNREVITTDALGGTTTYDYSTVGGPACCSPTVGSSLLIRMQDADGNVTFYHYDELDRRVQVVRKNSDTNDVINPTDAVTTTTYDPVGNVITVTDPVTNTTVCTYDADNRQISIVDAAGDISLSTYDADGNTIAVTAPNLNVTTNVYDALNRVIDVYDDIGLVFTTTYDAVGNVTASTDPLGHTTTCQYDHLNRRVETIDPLGQATTTAYDADGNVTSSTDRNGHTTTFFYDGLDRRTLATDALGNSTATAYDLDSNVTGLTDANGHTTTYRYDALNRQVTETYPDATHNTRIYVYDAVGNLTGRQDQKNQITTYSYSPLYFMTNRSYLPSGAHDSFAYDLDGRMTAANRNGWVDTFAYDSANRLTNTLQNGRMLTRTYNIPDRVQTNTQPSGRTLIYTYDARNRLAAVKDLTLNPPIAIYTYDAANRLVTRTNRNGTTTTYAYNADNWVTSLQHSNSSVLIAGFGYAYDNEGNKLYEQKLDRLQDSEAYAYDAVDRLTNYDVGTLSGSVIPAPAIAKTWNLDPLGNWNSVVSNGVPQVRTHGPANELLKVNATFFIYDFDGNLSNDTVYAYVYDEENRLTQMQRLSDSTMVGQYYYDALGRRVTKIASPGGVSSTNEYFYDNDQIIEEQNAGGATTVAYTYGNYVDEALTMDAGGQTFFYHQNLLWSVAAVTDSSGNPAERYAYDAYGRATVLDAGYNPLPANPWGTPHSAIGNPYLFTGRENDEEAGLYFYRSRYYDPQKGRFLQRDHLEYGDSMNLYEYVRSNPTANVDPNGMKLKVGGKLVSYDSDLYQRLTQNDFNLDALDVMISSDVVFERKSEAELEAELKMREAFVKCMRRNAPATGGCRYGKPWPSTKSKLWNGNTYKGDDPSQALDSYEAGPSKLDCFSMGTLCMWIALRDALGAAEFNKRFKDKTITINGKVEGQPLKYPPASESTVFIPGDFVMFRNADHYFSTRKDGANTAYSNENAAFEGMVNGSNTYCGFGITSTTAGGMLEELLENYNKGADPDMIEKYFGKNAPKRSLANTKIRIDNVRRPNPGFTLP